MGEKIKKTKLNKTNISWKILNRILFAVIIFFGASYLIGVNDLSIKTIVLQKKQISIFELRNVIAELDLRATALGSYNSVSQRLPALSLVKVDKVEYVDGLPAVAVNK